MDQAIKNASECYKVCLETKMYCLKQGGKHVSPEHMQALADCIEACKISENFMIRNSPLHSKVCAVCAEACKKCAESCEAMGDDQQMKKCAQACRKCEETCRAMANM